MKRFREPDIVVPWPVRLRESWDSMPLPRDMWRTIIVELVDDLPAVLALGRVNLALYATLGGFEHMLKFILTHGHEAAMDRSRRAVVNGNMLLHPLKWACWTEGNYVPDAPLFQQVAAEMDRAEPGIRRNWIDTEPVPVIAGGFVRVLMLRLLRRAGVTTPPQLSEHYGDIDVWFEAKTDSVQPYIPLMTQIAPRTVLTEEKTEQHTIYTFPRNEWSARTQVQCILTHLDAAGRSYAECVLYYFDFTPCQVGVILRTCGDGEVVLTPAFLYSLLTGRMFIGPRLLPLPGCRWPFDSREWGLCDHIQLKQRARLLRRFSKYMHLGYTDALLSAYDVARMTRLLTSASTQEILGKMALDDIDYMFLNAAT